MNCPECGKENPDSAKNCQFCNAPMNNTTDSAKPVTIKVSRLATTGIILAICGLILIIPSLINLRATKTSYRNIPIPYEILSILSYISLFSLGGAITLGLVSFIKIEINGGKTTGRNFAIGAILIPIFTFLFLIWSVFYPKVRSVAFTNVCGTNLSGIGKAILIYANDYDDKFPRAGNINSTWGTNITWNATNSLEAYGLHQDGSSGSISISSSLYLLVKYAEVTPKAFLCKGDKKISEFNPANYGERDKELIDLWDFGPESWKHCSYSYHMPYSKYALTTSNDPGLAVAADRNPWIPSLGWKVKNFAEFNPDGGRDAIKAGNTFPHRNEVQNVLFIDSHVDFENTPCCGINEDNIYTYQDGGDIRRGSPPQIGSQPANRADSMLVNDPPVQ